MNAKKSIENGHKKTIINTNKSEIKEFLTYLKKKFNTSASYRELPEGIEIKLNGHHDLREIIKL